MGTGHLGPLFTGQHRYPLTPSFGPHLPGRDKSALLAELKALYVDRARAEVALGQETVPRPGSSGSW